MPPFASKRKRDEVDDWDDDDEPSFGRQILPVANLPENFSGTPTDGMQYLFTVRRDARYLPHVTRVANPFEDAELPPPPPQSDTLANQSGLPSPEWRAHFEKHYRNFRKNITQPTIHVQPAHNANHRLMPDKRERDLWWAFIAGRPDSDWNPPKKPKPILNKRRKFGHGMRGFADDPESDVPDDPLPSQETWHINDEGEVELALRVDPTESLPTPTGSPAPQGPSTSINDVGLGEISAKEEEILDGKPREPTPTLMRHIDQRMALHLLMYFTHWITLHLQQPEIPSSQLTETHVRWIFSLLSRIEDHISADDMSLLRNLARACLALLKELIRKRSLSANADEPIHVGHGEGVRGNDILMGERSCWIIISIVVGIWGQRDLWVDAEEMLASLRP